MKKIKVDFKNEQGNLVASYVVKKTTVAMNSRRIALQTAIFELKLSDVEKSHMLSCANLAAHVFDKDDQLVYPDKEGADNQLEIINSIYEDMDIEIYDGLVSAFNEVNPTKGNLKAKKKRY